MKSVAIAAMMLVPAVTSAAAQVDYESSAWLLERCEARDGRETGFCMGYIAGVAVL
jgi:hypothetical protein